MPDVSMPFASPDRVLLAGDWHGSDDAAWNALRFAQKAGAGAVIQLGDFGLRTGALGDSFLENVSKSALAFGIPVLWLDGNHEDFTRIASIPIDPETGLQECAEQVWRLPRGSRWDWGGVSFMACGGATSLDRLMRREGVSWWPEEEITNEDISAACQGGAVDFMLTHDCPAKVNIPRIGYRNLDDSRFWPMGELERAWNHRDKLDRIATAVTPYRVAHGHFHTRYTGWTDAYGRRTRVDGLADGSAGILENIFLVDMADLTSWLEDYQDDPLA